MHQLRNRLAVFFCVLAAFEQAQAQSGISDLKAGQWSVYAEQSRLSAFIDGRLANDENAPILSSSDRVDTWARNQWAVAWRPIGSPFDLQWGAFIDAQLHVDGHGAKAVARVNNKVAGFPGTQYAFDLSSEKHRRLGLSASRVMLGDGFGLLPSRWMLGANVFVVDQYRLTRASGLLEDNNMAGLALTANVTENTLGKKSTFIQPEKILGSGATFDMAAVWGRPDIYFFSVSVRDIGSSVRLKQVLGKDSSINTNAVSFDKDGFVQIAPVISGAFVNRRSKVRVHPELRAEGGWQQLPGKRWVGQLVKHGTRQEAGVLHQSSIGEYRLDLGAHFSVNLPTSLSLGFGSPNWRITWRGDRLVPNKAKIWSLSAQLVH